MEWRGPSTASSEVRIDQRRLLNIRESENTKVLLDAIAILMDWRLVQSFRCDVTFMQNGTPTEYELVARPGVSSYVCTEKQTGRVFSHDEATGETISASERIKREPNQLRTEPLPIRLAFPLSLDVWGRRSGGWRMVDAERSDDEILVLLRHQTDPHLFGSLTIDTKRRLAVRLDTVTQVCHYTNIGPDLT